MSAFFSIVRKGLVESRWMIGMITVALFGMSWFSVYRTTVAISRLRGDGVPTMRARMFMERLGGPSMDFSAGAIEALTLYWLFLMVPLLLTISWGIGKGSAAVAGELERGSVDLILSRPVSRTSFYFAQVAVALIGLLAIVAAIALGNQVGTAVNRVSAPPTLLGVLRPAFNLALVGWAVFGYSVMLSSVDLVRWRPNLLAAALTIGQFIALAIANQPDWDEYKWLNNVTVLSAFYPVEAAVKGALLAKNAAILGGVGLAGTVLGYLAFQSRDLPAGGG